MKTPLLFIAALASFVGFPVDFTLMASVLFAAGLVAILVADYGRKYRPIGATAFGARIVPYEQFRLAA